MNTASTLDLCSAAGIGGMVIAQHSSHWSAKSIPELWMMDHAAHLRGTVKREQVAS